ncbi:MAG: transposase family protein [Chloroflexales bacterium]|nr:transposase family protein [Chloroflexales bacterium]
MSYRAKRELLAQTAPRYQEASHQQKSVILDEFVAATGYARKYAIRLLISPVLAPPARIARPRERQYGAEVQAALRVAWEAANGICAKRLVPFLPDLVASLERHGHLQLPETVRTQLLAISPATVDRILSPIRRDPTLRGISTTKAGTLLKHQVPIRTFTDWDDAQPGFFEVDLVAHCGGNAEGAFLYTLVLTDVATGWTECIPLLNRGQHSVIRALDHARQLVPMPLMGIDTDNGGEFLNT